MKREFSTFLLTTTLLYGMSSLPAHALTPGSLSLTVPKPESSFAGDEFTDLYHATRWIENAHYENALPYLSHGREIAPTNLFILYNLAMSYYELGQIQDAQQATHLRCAEETFVRLQSLAPELLSPYLKLGKIAILQNRLGDAIDYYQQGLIAIPHNSLLLFNMGGIYDRQGKIDKAIEYYQEAIHHDPDMVYAYNNLGLIYEQLKQLDKAEQAYLSAVQHDASYNFARLNLGTLYLQKGKYIEAKEQFIQAAANEPKNPWIYLYLGNAYYRLQNYHKAVESYRQSIEYNPAFSKTYYLLTISLYKLQRNEEALATANHYLSLEPQGPYADELNHLISLLKQEQETARLQSNNLSH